MGRSSVVERKTKETDIKINLELDGTGQSNIDTGIGFFDHMLTAFSKHGFFDLDLSCKGDLEVDCHHTVEDCGIALGEAIKKAAGDKAGIKRYGSFMLPMDETLVACAVDLCGRPYFSSDIQYPQEICGDMEMDVLKEFFYGLSCSGLMNLHFKMFSGDNSHHIAEACFKAFAKSLDMALSIDPRIENVLSTKGML
ncbi:MAG: imidazoleglycerol-phosphate dehydratase HisB [Lachnospiraceae bacterium]|nr:imidazoleglycerol-phosphate dehydratase HisB [Lachnospiraceae bacterium]